MTSQRLVEEFARWLYDRDWDERLALDARIPDSYLNEAAVFLGGELGQRLQHDQAGADLLALVVTLGDLRDEIADRANVEADLRAQLAEAELNVAGLRMALGDPS